MLRWHYLGLTLLSVLCLIVAAQDGFTSYSSDNEKTEINIHTASDDELKARLREYGVHYNIKSIFDVLERPEYKHEETVNLLCVKYEEIRKKTPMQLPKPEFRHPIISIDGFFTHGRTKIAKMVAGALNGRRILLPTQHVTRLRTYFGKPELKKHYYSLSKYIGSHLAKTYCRSGPVVIERYWHDQATYVIAKTFDELVPRNSSIYNFPEDLLVPDLMFYVNGALNQQIHNQSTAEQHTHNALSLKILQVFKRMKNPLLIEIGPPSLPIPMVKKILAIVKSIKQNFLPKPIREPIWHVNGRSSY